MYKERLAQLNERRMNEKKKNFRKTKCYLKYDIKEDVNKEKDWKKKSI